MLFYTSDWHLFDRRVIQKSNRPFRDLDHMHEVFISNFNSRVGPKDTTVFMGDMTYGSTAETKRIIDRLNGTKIIVLGNHDPSGQAMMNSGFHFAVNTYTCFVRGERVLASHYPFRPTLLKRIKLLLRGITLKYLDRRPKDDGKTFLLHGHTHSKHKLDGRRLHVGCDAWNYKPVSQSEVESHIDKQKGKEPAKADPTPPREPKTRPNRPEIGRQQRQAARAEQEELHPAERARRSRRRWNHRRNK